MVLTVFGFDVGIQRVKDDGGPIADQDLWFVDREVRLDNLFHIVVEEAMWIFLPLDAHDFELIIYLALVVVIFDSSSKVVGKFAVLLIGYVWHDCAARIIIVLLSPIFLVWDEIVLVIISLFPFFIKASVSPGGAIGKAVLALLISSSPSWIGLSERLAGPVHSPIVLLFHTVIWVDFRHIVVLNRSKYLSVIVLIAWLLIHLW